MTAADDAAYPRRWAADVALGDGSVVHIRPVRPDDADEVVRFHERQGAEDQYLRYHTSMPRLTTRMVWRLTHVDHVDHVGFVAELGDTVVAMASYDVWPERGGAEVAFLVDRGHRDRGLATVLLEYLVVAAREAGIPKLVAMVLPSNRRMLSVFHRAGFEVSSTFEDGVVEVVMDVEPSEAAALLVDERARRAEARSVERLLHPTTIAVVGAGRTAGGLGHELFVRLLRSEFAGSVYPVNPHGGHIAGVRAWPSVLDIPDEVDLAVLAAPADACPGIVAECARKRVRGLIVTSAGFVDGGSRLVAEARRWGMRVIGPESLGAINTAPGVSMTATYAPVEVLAGPVGFLTQSGTLGVAALEMARRVGVGISTFVDVGRKVDVSGNDLLQFWEEDPRTTVATLYIESFGNPAKFVRIARRMARHTPIVAVKGGDLRPGALGDAADGWSAPLTYDAFLSQAGVVRVDSLRELFDVARTLLHQPVPGGRQVVVISNSRGASALAADACIAHRLTMATPGVVELGFDAAPYDYELALRAAAQDPSVDAAVVVYAPATRDRRDEVGRALGAVDTSGITVVGTFLGAAVDRPLVTGRRPIPLFELPGDAVRVLARLAEHRDWLDESPGAVPGPDELGFDLDRARAVVAAALVDAPSGRRLSTAESAEVADALLWPVVATREVGSVDDAVHAAQELTGPVVLKAGGVDRYFPGEQGGVSVGLRHGDDVRAAFERMADLLGDDAMRVARVQASAPGGADVFVAAHQHPSVGGIVTVGAGGIAAVSGTDVRPVRVLPLSDAHAARLVAAAPVAATLAAVDPSGTASAGLASLLVRIGASVDAIAELADVVLNPIVCGPDGVLITDVELWVRPSRSDEPPSVRRLG